MSQLDTDKVNENISGFTDLLQSTIRLCSNAKPKPNKYTARPFPRNSWFDAECKEKKREVKRLAKHVQKRPGCTLILNNFWRAKREYKALTRQKKRRTTAELHAKLEAMKTNNPRIFWSKIRATEKTSEEPIPINIKHLHMHFSDLADGPLPTTTIKATLGNEFNILTDTPFSEEEVLIAVKRLKRHKAPGPDGLPPVVFKLFNNCLISHLTTLFNSILSTETFPEAWSLGAIKPIYKKGDKSIPSNYRGITLLNVMGKIFTSIIRDRISNWAESNGKLNESQFGFRANRRTTDAIFIINTITQIFRKKKKPLYTCFIDFSKAFDKVHHALLWEKLASIGISSKMLSILQSMYAQATSRLCANHEESEIFACRRGVRQGCNLSPLLFSLFINDLDQFLTDNNSGSVQLVQTHLRLLLFADDLVLLASSPAELQTSINLLGNFCEASNLSINFEKTKIVIYNNKRNSQDTQFSLNEHPIEVVKSYKYLGILLSDSASLKPAISTLTNQAQKAMFSLFKKIRLLQFPKPSLLCHLFDSLISPIANYGCEVWGHVKADDLEIVHRRFCKFALGVPNTATNLAVYGELGRVPLEIKRRSAIIKYWLRIVSDWNTPVLLKEAYLMQTESGSDWLSYIKQTLDNLGFSNIWSNPSSVPKGPFLAELEQRCRDQYVQTWHSQLASTTGKLRFYKLFKTTFERESYLNLPPHLRVPITKVRISCHPLHIETGRYRLPTPIPCDERFCWYCDGRVEDELHFVFQCRLYEALTERTRLLQYCQTINYSFNYLEDIEKFRLIWKDRNGRAIYLLGVFLLKAFQLRQLFIRNRPTTT